MGGKQEPIIGILFVQTSPAAWVELRSRTLDCDTKKRWTPFPTPWLFWESPLNEIWEKLTPKKFSDLAKSFRLRKLIQKATRAHIFAAPNPSMDWKMLTWRSGFVDYWKKVWKTGAGPSLSVPDLCAWRWMEQTTGVVTQNNNRHFMNFSHSKGLNSTVLWINISVAELNEPKGTEYCKYGKQRDLARSVTPLYLYSYGCKHLWRQEVLLI